MREVESPQVRGAILAVLTSFAMFAGSGQAQTRCPSTNTYTTVKIPCRYAMCLRVTAPYIGREIQFFSWDDMPDAHGAGCFLLLTTTVRLTNPWHPPSSAAACPSAGRPAMPIFVSPPWVILPFQCNRNFKVRVRLPGDASLRGLKLYAQGFFRTDPNGPFTGTSLIEMILRMP